MSAGLDDLDDIVDEFLTESAENLDQLDRDLVALEADPASRPLLSSVFRTIHTIKGTTGFLGFGHLEAVAHAGETLLSKLRDGDVGLTAAITDGLLAMVDAIRELLTIIESTGSEGAPDHTALIATLLALTQANTAEPTPAPGIPPPRPVGEHLPATVPGEPPAPAEAGPQRASDTSVRVDVALLDALLRLVGELVLTRNSIAVGAAASGDPALVRASARLNAIASDLQDDVMKTRMRPIDTVWSKLPRMVRDLAVTCGKPVRLEMEGRDTGLDKTILEAVKDPLTHLVRNAIDHGIEDATTRSAAGKDPVGLLSLRAYHRGGDVHIEIRDDGAGLDGPGIAAMAVERGLATEASLAGMGEAELARLIFLPGFSTAAAVTNVSGRGVGMDVVRTNVEAIGGSIDVTSMWGSGTTFHLRLPLTLAIIDVLTVMCEAQEYALPRASIVELLRMPPRAGPNGVESLLGAPTYRLRGALLPLVYLGRVLAGGCEPVVTAVDNGTIVVLDRDGHRFGLVVDDVVDIEEVVVKPLTGALKKVPAYGGATILASGRVALILDVAEVGRMSHAVRGESDPPPPETSAPEGDEPTLAVLMVDAGCHCPIAIPLELVLRLETFPASSVENVHGDELVRYRGGVLPLLPIAAVAAGTEEPRPDVLQVVVCRLPERHVGLIVSRILEIVERAVPVVRAGNSTGPELIVVHSRIAPVLDVATISTRDVLSPC